MIVGTETSDDAGVFRLRPDLAIVNTVDFFTPIVDDPYTFGQMAAANALSDIYAMGAEPKTALNIVAFPKGTMDIEVLGQILRGGAERAREAGAVVIGGHSIIDEELKYGMAVTGVVHPDRVIRNVGVQERRRAGAHQTARHRHHHDGAQEAEGVARQRAGGHRVDDRAQQGGLVGHAQFPVHACSDVTGYRTARDTRRKWRAAAA